MKNSKFIFGSDTPLPHEYPLNMLSEYLKSAANATSPNRLSRMRLNEAAPALAGCVPSTPPGNAGLGPAYAHSRAIARTHSARTRATLRLVMGKT